GPLRDPPYSPPLRRRFVWAVTFNIILQQNLVLHCPSGGGIPLLPRLRIDGSLKEKNACAEIRAGVKTGLFDNKLGASLNVMSMVFDEA
ncbi:hypothetical protein, partial [Klebsiella pneumoniae]|uniref:hypothetical protein n=1 Tax=Klebsiella pneumoniae TaxID=573 RepID=UPI00236313BC